MNELREDIQIKSDSKWHFMSFHVWLKVETQLSHQTWDISYVLKCQNLKNELILSLILFIVLQTN